jgi:hypothetical protein
MNGQPYEPEIGQAVFGNPTGAYDCPEFVDAFLSHILSEIARVFWNKNQRKWDSYEDPQIAGVEFRPYYWGDCTCGYDILKAAWENTHHHTNECFHERYAAEDAYQERRCARTLEGLKVRHDHMTKWAKDNGYPQAPFGMAVYCDCGLDREWQEWASTHNHAPDCESILPNFKYGEAEIRWYKHPGRGMSVNVDWDEATWRKWLDSCLAAIRKEEAACGTSSI